MAPSHFSLGKSWSVYKRDCCELSGGGGGFRHRLTPRLKPPFISVNTSCWVCKHFGHEQSWWLFWELPGRWGTSRAAAAALILFHVLLSPPKLLEGKNNNNKKTKQKRWQELVMQCHKQGWRFLCAPKASDQSMWMQIRMFYSWDVICYWPWSPGQPLEPPLHSQSLGRGHVTGGASPKALWDGCCSLLTANCSRPPLLLLSFQRDICVLFVVWQLTEILMAHNS